MPVGFGRPSDIAANGTLTCNPGLGVRLPEGANDHAPGVAERGVKWHDRFSVCFPQQWFFLLESGR